MAFQVVQISQGATPLLLSLRVDRATGKTYILEAEVWTLVAFGTPPPPTPTAADFIVVQGRAQNQPAALLVNQTNGETWYLDRIAATPPFWQFQHIAQPT